MDQAETVIDGLDKLAVYQAHVKRFKDLNIIASTPGMVEISANAILLLAAITDFLRDSVVYLETNFPEGYSKDHN